MTANEMANELELELDRSASFGSPGYEDFELSSVLTKAQELFIKKFIDKKNNRKLESFEESEIRGQGLSALLKQGISLPPSSDQIGTFNNGVYYDLPEDFMYTVEERVITDKILCDTVEDKVEAAVRVVPHDKVSRWKNNKYKKPYCFDYGDALVWRLYYSREIDGSNSPASNKRHQLLTDGTFNVDGYTITYLKNPTEIKVDQDTPPNQINCILDESTHLVIVSMASDLMMDRVKEQKAQNIESLKDLE